MSLSLGSKLHNPMDDDDDAISPEELIPSDASPADARRFRRTYRGQRWYGDHLPACDISGPAEYKARKGKDIEVESPYYQKTKTGMVDLVKGVPKPMIVPSYTTIAGSWPQEFFKNVADATGKKYRVPLDSLRTADWFLENYALVSQLPQETARALGAQFAVDDLMRRADEGTEIHTVLECVALDLPFPDDLSEAARLYERPVREWFDKVQPEVLLTETVAFNWNGGAWSHDTEQEWTGMPYACTLDLVARIGGKVWYLDAKSKGYSSDGKLANHGIFEKYTAQVAAASFAEYGIMVRDEVAVRERLPKGDFGGILSVRPDGVVMFPTDLSEGWTAFFSQLECFYSQRDGRSAARRAIMKTKGPDNRQRTAHLDLDALGRGEMVLLPFEKDVATSDADDDDVQVFDIPLPPTAAPAPVATDPVTPEEPEVLTPVAEAEVSAPAINGDENAVFTDDPLPGAIKVLITGSRDLSAGTGRAAVFAALDAIHEGALSMVVVHGACPTGADRYAAEWVAERTLLPRTPHVRLAGWRFEARWDKFGPSAGPLRNRAMVLHSNPNYVHAFTTGELEASKGTLSCVNAVKAAQIKPVIRLSEHLGSSSADAIDRDKFEALAPVHIPAAPILHVSPLNDPESSFYEPDAEHLGLVADEPVAPFDTTHELAEQAAEDRAAELAKLSEHIVIPPPPGYAPDPSPVAAPLDDEIAAYRIAETIGAVELEGPELAAELGYAQAFKAFLIPIDAPTGPPPISKETLWEYVVKRIKASCIEIGGRIAAGTLPATESYDVQLKHWWTIGEAPDGPRCVGITFSASICPNTMEDVKTVLALVDELDNAYEPPVPFAANLGDPRLALQNRPTSVDEEGGLADPEVFAKLQAEMVALEDTPAHTRINQMILPCRAKLSPGNGMRTVRRAALLSAYLILVKQGFDDDTMLRAVCVDGFGINDPAAVPAALLGRLNLPGAQKLLAITLALAEGSMVFSFDRDGVGHLVDAFEAKAA